ncbi:hypothetical protein COCVIDRAFT_90837 [Bipolaris victoriae FI3]|uniref:Uncharacterized protein n=1 Tax=Bipolaris victoriae (strain FI3) TaxID=930091 RepID=W7F1R3_BIPV3|nr:hypothetical protein COCVIDRAFT_90837 [Bipolaris victoriae FI3]
MFMIPFTIQAFSESSSTPVHMQAECLCYTCFVPNVAYVRRTEKMPPSVVSGTSAGTIKSSPIRSHSTPRSNGPILDML